MSSVTPLSVPNGAPTNWTDIQSKGTLNNWHCNRLSGFLSAMWIKATNFGQKEAIANKIAKELFKDDAPGISGETLRWFSGDQLQAVQSRLSLEEASDHPQAQDVFEKAIFNAQNDATRAALTSTYESCILQRTTEIATTALTTDATTVSETSEIKIIIAPEKITITQAKTELSKLHEQLKEGAKSACKLCQKETT